VSATRSHWQPEDPGPPAPEDQVAAWVADVVGSSWEEIDAFARRLILAWTADVCLAFCPEQGGLCVRYRGCSEEPVYQRLGPPDVGEDLARSARWRDDDDRPALEAARAELATMLEAAEAALAAHGQATADKGNQQ
jgi:hypothetical protein